MSRAIESLLVAKEEVEIIIVNDGSTDRTKEIAEEYETKYPTIVKAISQENGGHGEAINTGLALATGLYFKVVDSDDWVDPAAYRKLLDCIEDRITSAESVDLIINNFVYEKVGAKNKKIMKYDSVLPEEKVFTWNEVGNFKKGQYIMMHSLVYRTSVLRASGLHLPRKTFYVDNLFVYVPLPFVEKMYYLNEEVYRYFIGRDDQSVNEKVMIQRIDQQIKVNKQMVDAIDLNEIESDALRDYLLKHLEIVTVVSSIFLIKSGTEENLQKKQALMEYIRENNRELYNTLKYGLLGRLINLPTRLGRGVSIGVYKVTRKVIGFN